MGVVLIIYFASNLFTGVLAELPPPINVRIDSINMELVLQWDAALNTTDNITYTAEYRQAYTTLWSVLCGQQHCSPVNMIRNYEEVHFQERIVTHIPFVLCHNEHRGGTCAGPASTYEVLIPSSVSQFSGTHISLLWFFLHYK